MRRAGHCPLPGPTHPCSALPGRLAMAVTRTLPPARLHHSPTSPSLPPRLRQATPSSTTPCRVAYVAAP
ncbi:hypothetical protein E2562_026928 [Oryza meyeriana var. granulata]|uniref:Uncharacterized protein n=1 Tax=Oryza meyeriana var. granulata TaxID=110450 RepID=A0A6G1EZ30_9ORYZ|nr:hypothetical protein E2562_026928 [Oryza meyeriana var. granulata]